MGGKRIVAQERDHRVQISNARLGVILLPIDHCRLVAADRVCHVDLPEVEIKAALSDHLADGFWGSRISRNLTKIDTPKATLPL